MAMIKLLTGFIAGLVFGGVALVALLDYAPQTSTTDVPAKQAVEKTTVLPPQTALKPTPKPVMEPISPKTKTTQVQTQPVVPNLAKVKIAEPEMNTAAEQGDGNPISKIVLNSDKPKTPDKPKLFNLPTISPDQPDDSAGGLSQDLAPAAQNNGISIGQKPSSTLPSITANDAPPQPIATPAEQERALELYATQFEAPDRPILGVILLDIGDKGLRVDQLKSLNAPLTIAILSDAPNASERALAYEAAGFEVIAMVSDAASAPLAYALTTNAVQDTIDVMFTTVPNAIGLLDSAEGRIQKNGRIAKAIIDVFVDSGHGFISYARGLNSVDREARASGVRTAKVARKLDANRENKAMMMRYLDRVSLDAGRDGAALVLGTTAKDTVAALAGWVLSSKGRSVTLAPASAVLLGK